MNGLHDCTRHTCQEFSWLLGGLSAGQREVISRQIYDGLRGVLLPLQRPGVVEATDA